MAHLSALVIARQSTRQPSFATRQHSLTREMTVWDCASWTTVQLSCEPVSCEPSLRVYSVLLARHI